MNSTQGAAIHARAVVCAAVLLVPAAVGCESSTENRLPLPSPRTLTHARPIDPGLTASADDYHAKRLQSAVKARSRLDEMRLGIAEHELAWTRTAQDARAALMVSPDTGFRTWGVETSVAEIPEGWHTGMHRHGEEAIYIVGGSGFVIVEEMRYDFGAGTTIGIPYGAEHQLYNTGDGVVRYVSATPFPLERFVGIGELVQLSEAGPTRALPELQPSEDGFDERGRLIRLFWEDAEYHEVAVGLGEVLRARFKAGIWLTRPNTDGQAKASGEKARLATSLAHHGARVGLRHGARAARFPHELISMSGFLVDPPGAHSGRHAHMDAILYVVQGSGYSVIGGKRIEWRAGTSLHIPGPRTEHQHFNTGDEPAYLLRVSSGLRPRLERTVAESLPYLWFEGRGKIEQPRPE